MSNIIDAVDNTPKLYLSTYVLNEIDIERLDEFLQSLDVRLINILLAACRQNSSLERIRLASLASTAQTTAELGFEVSFELYDNMGAGGGEGRGGCTPNT